MAGSELLPLLLGGEQQLLRKFSSTSFKKQPKVRRI